MSDRINKNYSSNMNIWSDLATSWRYTTVKNKGTIKERSHFKWFHISTIKKPFIAQL